MTSWRWRCSANAAAMRPARWAPMPPTSVSRSGRLLDDLERVEAEALGQAAGQLGADAGDDAGAEELLDADQGLGGAGLVALDLELAAEPAVLDPAAAQAQRLALEDAGQGADRRRRGRAGRRALDREPDDGEVVVVVLEDDALDRAVDRDQVGVVGGAARAGRGTRDTPGSAACAARPPGRGSSSALTAAAYAAAAGQNSARPRTAVRGLVGGERPGGRGRRGDEATPPAPARASYMWRPPSTSIVRPSR